MTTTDEARQRAYYHATAASYHDPHVDGEEGEHDLALELLVMRARHYGLAGSFLDVGAVTGLAMKALASALPQARVQGIKLEAELRQQAEALNGTLVRICGRAMCCSYLLPTTVLIGWWKRAHSVTSASGPSPWWRWRGGAATAC